MKLLIIILCLLLTSCGYVFPGQVVHVKTGGKNVRMTKHTSLYSVRLNITHDVNKCPRASKHIRF